jgi:hypothetical protein
MSVRTAKDRFHFRGAFSPPAVASRQGDWCSKATGSATIAAVSGGAMALALAATNEVENGCLYMGDILPYDIDDLIRLEIIAKVSGTLSANTSLAFGLAGARNDAIDSIAQAALFRAIGNNTIVLETDDGTNEVDDGGADGAVISTSYKRFVIDFATGIKTQSAPSLSLGGKANILFYVGNPNGSLRQVGKNTSHSMAAYTGNLQLFAQLQKASSTDTLTLSLLEFNVEYKLPA